MNVIKKIEFQNEEIETVRLAQKVMSQACSMLESDSCFQCPFYQKDGSDGSFVCLESLLLASIDEMKGK